MDFQISEEQRIIVETASRVGARYGLDYWREQDNKKAFPQAAWTAFCEAGLAGIALPEAYGGSGLGMLEMALVIEELSAAGGGSTLAQLFMVNPIFGGVALAKFGTPAQKTAMLPPLIKGQMNFCMALTEPDAGSNSLEVRTFARADDDGWRLDGRKIWITAVPDAQKMLVVARTKKLDQVSRRTEGISLFLIDVARESPPPGWSGRASWRSGWRWTTPRSARCSATGRSRPIRACNSRLPRPMPNCNAPG
jgi:acyl-CoA dehydrogenase